MVCCIAYADLLFIFTCDLDISAVAESSTAPLRGKCPFPDGNKNMPKNQNKTFYVTNKPGFSPHVKMVHF